MTRPSPKHKITIFCCSFCEQISPKNQDLFLQINQTAQACDHFFFGGGGGQGYCNQSLKINTIIPAITSLSSNMFE